MSRNLGVAPTAPEIAQDLPGDDLVPDAQVVMDRAFTVSAPPEEVWPWINQLGKDRAGWYLPRSFERFVPSARRGIRHIEPAWQDLVVGDVIPDWGGKDASFTVLTHEAPSTLVHFSQRGEVRFSWAILLTPQSVGSTRLHLRLRIGGMRRPWLARTGGEFFDLLTIAGLASGLKERVR